MDKILIRPVFTYAAEKATLTGEGEKMLQAHKRKIIRQILRYIKQGNSEHRMRTNNENINQELGEDSKISRSY